MQLVRHRIGRRGAALLFFALVDFVYCFALFNPAKPLNETYAWAGHVLPLWAWAVYWGAVGVVSVVGAFLIHDTPAFTLAIAPPATWALLFVFGQLSGGVDRGYVSVALWAGYAAFVFLIAGGIPPPQRKGSVAWTRS